MMSMGTWWLSSASDPRWNASGRREVGMFMTYRDCAEALAKIEHNRSVYKQEPPTDLVFGYMKD